MGEDGSLNISGLRLSEEAEAHPVAMRSFWEVIPRACSHHVKCGTKGLVMVVVLYLSLTYQPRTHAAFTVAAGMVHVDILLYCAAAEYVSCVWLPLIEPLPCLAWLVTCVLVNLLLRYVSWHGPLLSALTDSSTILLIDTLLSSALYHLYKLYVDSSVYWRTPDYRHLCSYWFTTDVNRNHMLVARNRSGVCGTLGVCHVTSDIAMFNRVGVDPRCRGRGIAKKLLAAGIEYCKGQGYQQVILCVTNYMPDAENLYQKTGFQSLITYTEMMVVFTWYYLILQDGGDEEEVKRTLIDTIPRCTIEGVL